MSVKTKKGDKKIIANRLKYVQSLYDNFLMFYSEKDESQKKYFKSLVRKVTKQVIVNYDDHTTIYMLSRLCHWLNIPENNK